MEAGLDRQQRDALVAAMAEAMIVSNTLMALTQRLVARNALSKEDAQAIYATALATLDRVNDQQLNKLMADVLRAARHRAQAQLASVLQVPKAGSKREGAAGAALDR